MNQAISHTPSPIPPAAASLTRDPFFYGTVAMFALILTGFPALLGQFRLLPLGQSVALFVFFALCLRRGDLRAVLRVLAIWATVQVSTMALVSWLLPSLTEQAIADGFNQRVLYLTWFYGGERMPATLVGRAVEVVGVLLGSLVSGGLIGLWFWVRALNRLGFFSGALLNSVDNLLMIIPALNPWTLLRLVGYGGLIVALGEPLLAGRWSPAFILRERRRLLGISLVALALGLLLELVLPGLWRGMFNAIFAAMIDSARQ